jgi:hypothetical protein
MQPCRSPFRILKDPACPDSGLSQHFHACPGVFIVQGNVSGGKAGNVFAKGKA